MTKRIISVVLAVTIAISFPLKVFADTFEYTPKRGANNYELSNQSLISNSQMDTLMAQIKSKNAIGNQGGGVITLPVVPDDGDGDAELISPKPEHEGFKIYPITKHESNQYSFVGFFVGGNTEKLENSENLVSFSYVLRNKATGELTDVSGNWSATALHLPTPEPTPSNIYPDSRLFGYETYIGDSDNWQSENLFTTLDDNTVYQFEIKYEYSDSNTTVLSQPFMVYTLRNGVTLKDIVSNFGVSAFTVAKDNGLVALPIENDKLFLRSPIRTTPIPELIGYLAANELKYLGSMRGTSYSYGAVNIATGNLFYQISDSFVDEYGGFSISRSYNSAAQNNLSLFGKSFSSNLDIKLIQLTGSDARKTVYDYDTMGNMVELTTSVLDVSRAAKYSYALTGEFISTGEENSSETMEYDLTGTLTGIKYPSGKAVNYTYDARGNISGVLFGGAEESSAQYNLLGQKTLTKDKLGTAEYIYNEVGSLTDVKYNDGLAVAYEYDVFGNVIKISYPDGGIVEYTYDASDRMLTMEDKNGITSYEYDGIGNVTKEIRGDKSSTVTSYDKMDRKLSVTNFDASWAGEIADAEGDLAGIIVSKYDYSYDALGQVSKEIIADADGTIAHDYEYNKIGQLIQNAKYAPISEGEDAEYTEKTEYLYDAFGNKTMERIYENTTLKEEIEYTYNEKNQLVLKRSNGSNIATYEYDEDGNLSKETDDKDTKTYTYTEDNKVEKSFKNAILMSSYIYDANGLKAFETLRKEYPKKDNIFVPSTGSSSGSGNKTTSQIGERPTNTLKWKESFSSDPAVSEDFWTNHSENFTQDESKITLGTPDKYTTTVQTENESVLDEKAANRLYLLTYSGVVAMTSVSPVHTSSMIEFAKEVWKDIVLLFTSSYTVDATDTAYDKGTDDTLQTYSEIFSELVSDKTTTSQQASSAKRTSSLLTNFEQYIESSRSSNSKSASTSGGSFVTKDGIEIKYEPTRYVYDTTFENPQILAEHLSPQVATANYSYGQENRESNLVTGETYLYDGRGSVSEIVVGNKVTNVLRYDPYGKITKGEPKQDRTFGYNAEQYTPQTGLQYLRARHYDPKTGTFTSQDSYIGSSTNTVSRNRYVYGENNPINNIDPSGHVVQSLTKLAKGKMSSRQTVSHTTKKGGSSAISRAISQSKTIAETLGSSTNTQTTASKAITNAQAKQIGKLPAPTPMPSPPSKPSTPTGGGSSSGGSSSGGSKKSAQDPNDPGMLIQGRGTARFSKLSRNYVVHFRTVDIYLEYISQLTIPSNWSVEIMDGGSIPSVEDFGSQLEDYLLEYERECASAQSANDALAAKQQVIRLMTQMYNSGISPSIVAEKINYTINKINFSPATDINAILDASARAYKFAVDSNEAYWAQGTTENISYGMKNYTLSIDVAANPGVWQVIVSLAAAVGAFIASIPVATIAVIGAAIVIGGVVIYLGYQAISYLVGQLALEASSGAVAKPKDISKEFVDIINKTDNPEKRQYFSAYINHSYDSVMPLMALTRDEAADYVGTIMSFEDDQGVMAISKKHAEDLLEYLGGGVFHSGKKVEGYYPHFHPNSKPNVHIWYFK